MMKKIASNLSNPNLLNIPLNWVLNHADLFFLLLFFIFSNWLMWLTFRTEAGQLVIASKVWSDFAAHIPLIRSFSLGNNFPPEYPLFPGQPIKYHYLFYLLVGILEKLGLSIAMALNLLSALGMTLLLWMIYQITQLTFKSKKAGSLAVVLFLFNGSLTFLEFFRLNSASCSTINGISGCLNSLVNLAHFVSFGPWDKKIVSAFWNWNIYTNQRHLAFSFGLGLLLIWPLLKSVFNKKLTVSKFWTGLIVLSLSLLPLLHQATYAMVVWWILIWFAWHRWLIKSWGWVYGLGIVFSLATFAAINHSGQIRPYLGFLAPERQLISALKYWWFNIGLYLPLIFLVWWWANKEVRKFLLTFLSLFVLANLFQFSPDIINNHKLINFFLIGMNITVAGFLLAKWQQSTWKKPVVLITFFLLISSGIVDFFPIINDQFFKVDDLAKAEIIQQINKQTSKDGVFLTTTYLYNPASLAGRKIFLDYGYFAWSLGYPDRDRRQLLLKLFASDTSKKAVCETMKQQELDYLIISPGLGSLDKIDPRESLVYQQFIPLFLADGYLVYDLNQECRFY